MVNLLVKREQETNETETPDVTYRSLVRCVSVLATAYKTDLSS